MSKKNIIKVGDKGRHVTIPEGYKLIIKKRGLKGKSYHKYYDYLSGWKDLDKEDIDTDISWYDFVIELV